MTDVAINCWLEWKTKCAAALCRAEAKRELEAFASERFRSFARQNVFRTNDPDGHLLSIESWQAWHLLEVYFTARNNREGKRYKDWLFARTIGSSDDPIDVIQGGASLLMRNVVREYILRECPKWGTVSLQKPLSDKEMSATVEDLLPGTADTLNDVESQEYEALAARHADMIFSKMNVREKVALAAKESGFSLADPRVVKCAGCGKSVLNTSYVSLVNLVGAFVKKQHLTEDSTSLLYLAGRTLDALKKMIFKEISEKGGELTFLLHEEGEVVS